MLTCALLSGIYFFSARIYGDFCCILLSSENQTITDNYEILGISFFNNEYPLAHKNGMAKNNLSSYYKSLKILPLKEDSASTIIFYKENSNTCNKIAYRTEINETYVLPETNFQEKLKTNPLLPISLIISLISLLLSIILLTKFYINNLRIKKIIYLCFPIPSIILFCIIIFLTFNKIDDTLNHLNKVEALELNPDSQNIICISDTTGQSFEFTFSLDNKFWTDKDALINYISNIEVKDTFNTSKFIIQTWIFVYENTFHCHQEYTKTYFENFDCYLTNSIGHGLCSDRATLFCDIVEEKGYKTRIFNNPGTHTYPEVFDGKWKMMDVDYGTILINNNSEILSTEEIQNGAEHKLIHALNKMLFFQNAETFFTDTPSELISGQKYCSDNTKQIKYNPNMLNFSNFLLPANSTINMPLYDSVLMEYTAKIFIPTACNQMIKIPLVITSNNADMLVRLSKFDYFVSGENIEITALLNPMLFMNAKHLVVRSTNKLEITIDNHSNNSDIYYI